MKTELRACWYKKGKQWWFGRFHQWGTEGLAESGYMTVGIIETMDGAIITVPPEWVHFDNPEESP